MANICPGCKSPTNAKAAVYINAMCRESNRISEAHGFNDNDIPLALMLAVSELSEAIEELRSGHPPDEVYYRIEDNKPEGFIMELADVCIRIFHLCGKLDLHLGDAIVEKMLFNDSRPYKHGKEF